MVNSASDNWTTEYGFSRWQIVRSSALHFPYTFDVWNGQYVANNGGDTVFMCSIPNGITIQQSDMQRSLLHDIFIEISIEHGLHKHGRPMDIFVLRREIAGQVMLLSM